MIERENGTLLRIPPYFQVYEETSGEKGCMKFWYDTKLYSFQTSVSKTLKGSTIEKLCSGLNHLLLWAKDMKNEYTDNEYINSVNKRQNDFKRDFIAKITLYIHEAHSLITSESFKNIKFARMQERNESGERPTESSVLSDILSEQIMKLVDDPVLMTGILHYVNEFININSLDKKSNNNMKRPQKIDVSFNSLDLFGITVLIVITKFIQLIFSVYPVSTKADEIVFNPINRVLEVLQEKILNFYRDELAALPAELVEISENDYQANIIDYVYTMVDKEMARERNRAVFENVGISSNLSKNRILRTLFTSLYKIIPVLDTNEIKRATTKITDVYTTQDNWYEFKYVSNTIITYVNDTIRRIHANNSKCSTEVISHTTADDSTETNITYKQEMFLESRNKQALQRKKEIIRLLSRWCEDYRSKIPEYDAELSAYNIHIVETPLRAFVLTAVMNELNEDVTATQLIDKNTMINLLVVISHRLKILGYPNISTALLASGVSDNNANSIDYCMEDIKKLKKYMIDPIKTERYIKDIAGRTYVVYQSNNGRITIEDEFIRLLKAKENPEFRFVDVNIYVYNR